MGRNPSNSIKELLLVSGKKNNNNERCQIQNQTQVRLVGESHDGRVSLSMCLVRTQNFLKDKTPLGIVEQANFPIHFWENEDTLCNFQANWSGVLCIVSLNNQMTKSISK